jgi:thiosulfate/3-mercaptopyruvate sulfurtransferase
VPTLPGPLVSAAWLREHATHRPLRIVDLRWSLTPPNGRKRHASGHLPGAIFLDLDTEISAPRGAGPGRHPIPSGEQLGRALSARGIGDQHLVVAYDDASGSIASRLWWLFRHFGHEGSAAVLDGGLQAWTRAGGSLTRELPTFEPASWTPHPPRTDDVVDAAFVDRVRLDPAAVLLDVRAGERYRGEVEPVDARAGHIPGALTAPWTDNLDDDRGLMAADRLRQRFAQLGAEAGRPVVAYCGSGVTATQSILAMQLAGIPALLYEGSWSDWSSSLARPAAIGGDPLGERA